MKQLSTWTGAAVVFVLWVLVSIVAMLIGLRLGVYLSRAIYPYDMPHTANWFLIIPTTGLLLGLAQWLILRIRLPRGGLPPADLVLAPFGRLILRITLPRIGWWILATAIGWRVAWQLARRLVPYPVTYLDIVRLLLVLGVFIGAVVGVGQWLVIRTIVKRAWFWIIASVLGWAIGLFLGGTLVKTFDDFIIGSLFNFDPRLYGVAAAVAGIATAIALLALPGQRERTNAIALS